MSRQLADSVARFICWKQVNLSGFSMSLRSVFQRMLLATTLLGSLITVKSIGTEEIKFSTYNAFTVAIGSHLYTVSKYSSRVIVNSTDPNYKSCEATFHVHQGAVIQTPKAAATSSRKIVVTSKQSYNPVPGSNKDAVNYTVLLIDPFACSVKVVASPTEIVDFLPHEPPDIVVRADNTFDIFYSSQTICSPCRYDDEGRRVQVQHNLKPEQYVPLEYHLRELKDHNYAYTFDYGGDKTMLKVLDRDFNVISSIDVDPLVGNFANSNVADTTYIGAVLKVPEESFAFSYSVFEFKFKLRPVFSKFVKLAFGESIVGASIQIDSKGTSYVAHWLSATSANGTIINLNRYDANGRVVGDSMKIGKVAFNQSFRLQTILLQDKQFCLVIHEDGWASDDLTKIKCFDFAV